MLNRLLNIFRGGVPYHIDQDYHRVLQQVSSYYQPLEDSRKVEFRYRLYRLLSTVRFGGLHGITNVSRDMRAVIGSAFIQITMGLPSYLPQRFRTIYVLPRRYAYPGFGEPFLGHIDYQKMAVYLSWQDVLEGFAIPDDAVNVTMHEMAHLLEAEEATSQVRQQFFRLVDWHEWAQVAHQKIHIIRNGQGAFIKDYASTNMQEMFASCVEAFFEQSDEFKAQLPHIYGALSRLLRQDPINRQDPLTVAVP